jgi:prolipoprotein diacylglyceryl transferase
MNMLSFIHWNPAVIAFSLGAIEVRWYSIFWCIGLISVYHLMHYLYKKQNIGEDKFEPMFIYCFLGILIGARLGHCLFYQWDYYTSNPVEILKVWEGGLASHGGVFGVIFAAWLYSKKITKQSVWWLFDRIIPSVAVLCFCIRFGNLMNSEIFGFPTDLPWGFEFVRSREWHQLYEGQACHPTQIYEMLYCLVAGLTSLVMYHKFHLQKYIGLITGVSLLIFFGTRFVLEFMKNPQVTEEVGMALNIGQLLSLPLILLGVYLIWNSRKARINNK